MRPSADARAPPGASEPRRGYRGTTPPDGKSEAETLSADLRLQTSKDRTDLGPEALHGIARHRALSRPTSPPSSRCYRPPWRRARCATRADSSWPPWTGTGASRPRQQTADAAPSQPERKSWTQHPACRTWSPPSRASASRPRLRRVSCGTARTACSASCCGCRTAARMTRRRRPCGPSRRTGLNRQRHTRLARCSRSRRGGTVVDEHRPGAGRAARSRNGSTGRQTEMRRMLGLGEAAARVVTAPTAFAMPSAGSLERQQPRTPSAIGWQGRGFPRRGIAAQFIPFGMEPLQLLQRTGRSGQQIAAVLQLQRGTHTLS